MSQSTKNSSSQTALLVGIGVCVGATAILYTLKRRAESHPEGPDSSPPPGVPTPQTGDLLLFHNAKGMNKFITMFTRSPFYHVAIYDTDNMVVEAQLPGIQHNNIGRHSGDYVVAPAPEGKGREALAWAKTQIGDAYDRFDLVVMFLDHLCRFIHFNYQPRNKYTCGGFVATALYEVGVPMFPKDRLSDVVPADFEHLVSEDQRALAR